MPLVAFDCRLEHGFALGIRDEGSSWTITFTLRRYRRVRSRAGDYDNPGPWRIYSGLDRLLLIPVRSFAREPHTSLRHLWRPSAWTLPLVSHACSAPCLRIARYEIILVPEFRSSND
jgi:hypothetical protein